MTKTMAVVHNNVDDTSSIGSIAAWDVREALDRGWDVTVVCHDLDPALAGQVRHRRLYVPPRLHALQWTVARATLRAALRGWRPDVLVVHQPQLAALADVWNVHYLSRVARDVRGPREPGWRARVADAQAAYVARLEDHYLRRLPAHTRVLFCGDGLQTEFERRYGAPPQARVAHNPAFDVAAPRPGVDADRRHALVGSHSGPVLGFLGGADPRKGRDLLLTAIAAEPELFLVHAGPGGGGAGPRSRGLGFLDDVGAVLDVADVLVVPSRFEPFGLVVAEAAARGVPLVVSPAVGAADLVVTTGAGVVWTPPAPLAPIVHALLADPVRTSAGARELVARLNPSVLADERFADFEAVLAEKGR